MADQRKPALWLVLSWATQLSSVSLETAICVLLGYWGDQRWGTAPWLLVIGGTVGLSVSMWHLWQIVRAMDRYSRAGGKQPERGAEADKTEQTSQ